jgi:hypothetical protein
MWAQDRECGLASKAAAVSLPLSEKGIAEANPLQNSPNRKCFWSAVSSATK